MFLTGQKVVCIDETIIYSVVWNDFEQRSHYAFELAAEKPAVAV